MVRTAGLYAAFAAMSIAVNIGTQMGALALYGGPYAIPASVALGTLTGLVAKYVLDKRWIFAHRSRDSAHEARTFLLYGAMGVVTTGVFWGTEYAFHRMFQTDAMRYVGGVIGLAVGYLLKYILDRRYVFTDSVART